LDFFFQGHVIEQNKFIFGRFPERRWKHKSQSALQRQIPKPNGNKHLYNSYHLWKNSYTP
ncbi:MAG: hypothetical protein AAF242_18415, partial [Bacteroidota bacterium]